MLKVPFVFQLKLKEKKKIPYIANYMLSIYFFKIKMFALLWFCCIRRQ